MNQRKTLAQQILWTMLRRWQRLSPERDRQQFLKSVPFFNELSARQLRKVGEIVFERSFEKDEFVFEEGQPGAALFLVRTGQVSVELINSGSTLTLARLSSGSFFGEMALLDGAPRSASARAVERTQALALYRHDLARLIQSEPETACYIYQALARIVGDRLRTTNELVVSEADVVAA